MNFDSIDNILDYAISEEQAAADFYNQLASKMKHMHMKEAFLDFAKEEMGHKQRLMSIKEGKKLEIPEQKIMDLKIGDYLVEQKPSEDMDYQAALILAMKAEKAAFRLYSDLAKAASNQDVVDLLLSLAQEEAKHKLRFELEYDDNYLKDN